MAIFGINRKLLPLKAIYFLTYASHAGVVTFIPLYAKQMGIRADVVGYMYAVISFITVLSKPLIGGLVDRYQKLKVILISLALIDIVADIGLNFIPTPIQKTLNYTNPSLICLQNSSYILSLEMNECGTMNASNCFDPCVVSCSMCQLNSSICKTSYKNYSTYGNEKATFHISLNCSNTFMEKCESDSEIPCNEGNFDAIGNQQNVSTTLQIWLLGIFTAVIYVCYGSICSLSDAASFNVLGNKPELFGRQIMYGTIGWGIFTLFSGYLNQIFTGHSETYSFAAGFYLMIPLLLFDIIVVTKLEVKEVKASKNIFKDVGLLVAKPRIILFLLQVIFAAVFNGFTRTFMFWYLRSLNASQLVVGLTVMAKAFLGIIPFFFFSGWIITKIGHVNAFTITFAAQGIQFMCYWLIFSPWWSLPIAIFEGPCFGLFYAAMTSYAKIIAPTGTEATVQGIASATYDGLGLALGSLLGGYGFRNLGERKTLFYSGIICFIFAIVNSIANAVLIMKNSKR